MMKLNRILFIGVLTLATACNGVDEVLVPDAALEIKGIDAEIDDQNVATRAVNELKETVGRAAFVKGDKIVFTTIKRTENPLESFTYSDIQYLRDDKTWNRV